MPTTAKAGFSPILLILAILMIAAVGGSEEPQIIKGDEISKAIENGLLVNLSGVIVEGDIIINKSNLKLTDSLLDEDTLVPIKIQNSRIKGKVIFDDTLILSDLDFQKTSFEKLASFLETHFESRVNFRGAEFYDEAIFGKAEFNESADFSMAQFDGYATFWDARFRKGPVNFEKSKFKNSSRFWGVRFDEGNVGFGWSRFEGPVSFWDAQFGGNVDFTGSEFNDTADFILARFDRNVNLMGTRFEKELYFNDVRFETLKASWSSLHQKLVCNGPMYILLIKNFKEMEQFEDADNCYYQYRDVKRKDREPGWPMVFDYLAWLSCGYGVRWQYTILSGIFVVALFSIYFEFNYIARSLSHFFSENSAQNPTTSNLWKSIKKSLSFSAMVLLSLPSDWYPYGKDEYSNTVKSHLYAAILERLIGWGLMLLLIGTLTRLMVRY